MTLLQCTKVSDCDTAQALGERVLEYLSYAFRRGYPAKLGSLNRRFGPRARLLGTSVRDIVDGLAESGRLEVFDRRGAIILVDAASLAEQRAVFSEDHLGCVEALEAMLSRAQ